MLDATYYVKSCFLSPITEKNNNFRIRVKRTVCALYHKTL